MSSGFRVWYQVYPAKWRTVRINEPHPVKQYHDFPTLAAATDYKAKLLSGHWTIVATITPTPASVAKETPSSRSAALTAAGFPTAPVMRLTK